MSINEIIEEEEGLEYEYHEGKSYSRETSPLYANTI